MLRYASKVRTMHTMKSYTEIRPLGIFRLGLALAVLVHHFGINLMPSYFSKYIVYLQPGTVGVYIFLFLSAYIIMTVALTGYFSRPVEFIKNRALRILPELFLSLIFAIIVQYYLFNYGVDANKYYIPTNPDAFSLYNIAMNFMVLFPYPNAITTWDFVIVFWSVKYEIIFYIIVFMFLMIAKLDVVKNKSETFQLIMAITSLMVIAINFFGGFHGPYLFMSQIFTFLACGTLYFLYREGILFNKSNDILSLFLILGALAYNTKNIINSNAVLLLFCVLIIASITLLECRVKSHKFAKIDHLCGDMSYTVFLFHVPIGSLVMNYNGIGWGSFIIASITSILASYLICKATRRMFAPLRNKIRGSSLD